MNLYMFLIRVLPFITFFTSIIWLIIAIKIYKIIHRKFILIFVVSETIYIFYVILNIFAKLGIGDFALIIYSTVLYTGGLLLSLIGLILCLKYLQEVISKPNHNETVEEVS